MGDRVVTEPSYVSRETLLDTIHIGSIVILWDSVR